MRTDVGDQSRFKLAPFGGRSLKLLRFDRELERARKAERVGRGMGRSAGWARPERLRPPVEQGTQTGTRKLLGTRCPERKPGVVCVSSCRSIRKMQARRRLSARDC